VAKVDQPAQNRQAKGGEMARDKRNPQKGGDRREGVIRSKLREQRSQRGGVLPRETSTLYHPVSQTREQKRFLYRTLTKEKRNLLTGKTERVALRKDPKEHLYKRS